MPQVLITVSVALNDKMCFKFSCTHPCSTCTCSCIFLQQCVQVLLRMGADTSAYKTDDGGNILHFAVECASHFKGTWEATKDTSQCLKELLKKTKLVVDQPDNNGMLSKIITSLLLATNQNQRSMFLFLS